MSSISFDPGKVAIAVGTPGGAMPPPPVAPPPPDEPIDVMEQHNAPAPIAVPPPTGTGVAENDARMFAREVIGEDESPPEGAQRIAEYLRQHRNQLSFLSLRGMLAEFDIAIGNGTLTREAAEQMRAPIFAAYRDGIEAWRQQVIG